LPLERQGQAQARGGLGQARGGQVPRSARQAPGLLDILGCNPSHVSLAASAASASVIPISGYFGMIKHIMNRSTQTRQWS
jgi:ABC-type branched-subunit amino acid transport system permease subunit